MNFRQAWAAAWSGFRRPRIGYRILAATVGLAISNLPAPAGDMVKISVIPSATYSPIFVAVDKGYFKDEGIDAQVTFMPLVTDSTTMAAMGQTDIGASAPGSALYNAGTRGLGFKIVASMGVHPAPTTTIPLMIRKDLWDSGEVRSGKDLKGRPVSTNAPGASIEYKLALVLAKYGLTLADIRQVAIGLPETLIALERKAVDAAVLAEPFATAAETRGLAVMDRLDSAEAVGDIGTVVIFNRDFMKDRRPVAVRAMKALIRAAKDLQPDNWKSDANIEILSRNLKLPPETIRTIAFPYYEPNLTVSKYIDSMQRQAEMHLKNKRIGPEAVVGVAGLIDESFVTEACR